MPRHAVQLTSLGARSVTEGKTLFVGLQQPRSVRPKGRLQLASMCIRYSRHLSRKGLSTSFLVAMCPANDHVMRQSLRFLRIGLPCSRCGHLDIIRKIRWSREDNQPGGNLAFEQLIHVAALHARVCDFDKFPDFLLERCLARPLGEPLIRIRFSRHAALTV
eukprot:1550232-Prymnesium_polylepis.2